VNQELVIFGASSDIATEFDKLLKTSNYKVHKFSLNDPENSCVEITNYIKDIKSIKNYINKLENPMIIFFNGFLAENRPSYSPSNEEIDKTYEINFKIPSMLIDSLLSLKQVKKFIIISSVAAIKPRYKNFFYGLSKSMLENYLLSLPNIDYLIIRFGKVLTKMSNDHSNPPFVISKEDGAKLIIKNISKSGIIYPTLGLKISSKLIKIMPLSFLNFLEQRI
jgi:short-subunit dehydrogenase